ncbi:MAG: CvpA family protein [Candidatus Omnitrophica bacterium]|nr:CvpA family protein [Candidatus Omnitrophota bacterium]
MDKFLPHTNWVDIIVLVFLIRGGYIGLERGFSIELFKTIAAVAACVISTIFYNNLGQWLTSHSFLSLQVANFLAFLFLFFLLLFVFKIVRIIIFRVMHLELVYGWEKWGGFTLGLLRSAVFASLFIFTLTLLPIQYLKESVEEKSLTGPSIKRIAPRVTDFILRFKPKNEEGR